MKLKGKFRKKKQLSEMESLRNEFIAKELLHPHYSKKQASLFSEISEEFGKWLSGAIPRTPKSFLYSIFKPVGNKYKNSFSDLGRDLTFANIRILTETYVALMVSISLLASILSAISVFSLMVALGSGALMIFINTIMSAIVVFFITFFTFYIYPGTLAKQRRRSIESNLPFALTHMASIASSGVPPENIFKLLTKLGEYGAVTEEAKKITRSIEVFGEDLTSALSRAAKETPSRQLKDLLFGMLAIIESGGNLKSYLNETAQVTLFNYKLQRRKYLETLSTFADIYTALLIAAPLFLVSILVVINIIPGSVIAGLTVPTILRIGVYGIIPVLNILFLALLTYTQPEV